MRGFYRALGVELAEWGQREVSVSCFADPEVHARQDRDASCSVNVESGLWNCHGCGEGGGLCDAATELGNTPREAMDLLIAYGLAERRPAGQAQQPRRPTASARPAARPVSRPAEQVALKVGESDVARWREQLVGVWPPRVLRAAQRSVWSRTVLLELGVWVGARADHDPGPRRFGQPARGCCATPVTITRPRCSRARDPAWAGSPSCATPGSWTLLVEGPPDMISARSRGSAGCRGSWRSPWQAE